MAHALHYALAVETPPSISSRLHKRMAARGFTLAELAMVVIAIVAVLAVAIAVVSSSETRSVVAHGRGDRD